MRYAFSNSVDKEGGGGRGGFPGLRRPHSDMAYRPPSPIERSKRGGGRRKRKIEKKRKKRARSSSTVTVLSAMKEVGKVLRPWFVFRQAIAMHSREAGGLSHCRRTKKEMGKSGRKD